MITCRLLLGVSLLVIAHLLSPPSVQKMVLRVSSTPDEVGAAVGQLIFDLSKQAITTHGRFTVALSGGSLPKVGNGQRSPTAAAGLRHC